MIHVEGQISRITICLFSFFGLSPTKRSNDQWSIINDRDQFINNSKWRINIRYDWWDACHDCGASTQLVLFGPPPPTPLGQRHWLNPNTVHVSTELTTRFKDVRADTEFLQTMGGNSYLTRLHRCRRGGGGVLYFCCTSHQTKPVRKLSSGFNVHDIVFASFSLRISEAQCRCEDWGSCRAHTMAWPRCYTCSQLHTSFEAPPCGEVI